MPSKRMLCVAATAVLTLTAACGSSGNSGDAGTSVANAQYTDPPTSFTVTKPLSKAAPSGITVAWVANKLEQSESILAGLKAAADTLGWTVKEMPYDPNNPATIGTAVQGAIEAAPDVIVVNGLTTEDIAGQLPQIRAAGIPLIPAATPDQAGDGIYPVLGTTESSTYLGKIIAANVLADAKSSGVTAKVLQLTVPAVAAYLKPADDAFEAELKAKCSDCTRDLLNITLPDLFAGTYTQQVVSYIQRNPDINYIVSDSSQLGNGLDAALTQAGIKGVKRFGTAAGAAQIQQLQAGQPGAWAVVPYNVEGWIIADQAARVLVGDPTDLWDSEVLAYVVTAGNAKDVDATNPEFPQGYEDMFKKMWGL